MAGDPVRIAAITSNASLVVALTLRVEEWDIASGPTAAAVEGLAVAQVVLIDRGTTELGLAELEDARRYTQRAAAIVIGDEDEVVPDDVTLLLRPFTLEDLANAINEAGDNVAAAPIVEGGTPTDDVVEVGGYVEEDEPDVAVFGETDFETEEPPVVIQETPPAPAPPSSDPAVVPLDDAPAPEPAPPTPSPPPPSAPQPTPAAEPARPPAASRSFGDDEDDAEPAPLVLGDEPAPADVDDEPAPMVAPIEPSSKLILDDDEVDEDPLEQLVHEAVEARHPEEERAPEAPPAAPAKEPAPEPAPAVVPTAGQALRQRSQERRWGRRRKKQETGEGPADIAAREMAAAAAATTKGQQPKELRARVASILVAGLDLHHLIDEMPILRSGVDLSDVVAGEIHAEFQAETVAIWLRQGEHFRVGGGRGLTNAEQRGSVPVTHPLLGDLEDTGAASLIVPVDLAGSAVAGIAGARTKALMATAVAIGPDRYAHITVGSSDFTEEDLDRLVEISVEAAPFFAVARLMDGFRAR